MATLSKRCPLCHKPLSKEEYLSITGRWDELREIEAKFRNKLHSEVNSARRAEREKVSREMIVKDDKIVTLTGQLRRLKEQSARGLTPQLEGLLYEKELARQLSHRFRQDRIVSAGKGGDVIHHVHLNGKRVGTIVYECKKVGKLQKAHIEQARLAMIQRGADFAVLVTTARAGNTFGFWTDKDVLLIHPTGALALTSWLRTSLIELAKARMPKSEREKAVREVLNFLASPEFKNALQDVVRRAEGLGKELKDEVRFHQIAWLKRFEHYHAIWTDARTVTQRVTRLIGTRSTLIGNGQSLGHAVEVGEAYPLEKATLLQAP